MIQLVFHGLSCSFLSLSIINKKKLHQLWLHLELAKFDREKSFDCINSLRPVTLQAEPSILTSLPSFSFFSVSHFTKSCRLCHLFVLCLKCHHPETWTGFQTFLNFNIRTHTKKNDRTILHNQVIPGHGNPQKRWTMIGGYSFKNCCVKYQIFHQVC